MIFIFTLLTIAMLTSMTCGLNVFLLHRQHRLHRIRYGAATLPSLERLNLCKVFENIDGCSRASLRGQILFMSTMEEQADEEARKVVRVLDTDPFRTGSPIDVDSPFGNKAISVASAKKEIISIAENGISEPQHAYRIDYLVKYLESKYVPIHTPDFYSMTHRGEWRLLYSNVLTKSLEYEKLSFEVRQSLEPQKSNSEGNYTNFIDWKYQQEPIMPDAHGVLEIRCNYRMNERGAMQVFLKEHILLPEVIPGLAADGSDRDKQCEDLLNAIQSSVPFQAFDPADILVGTSYIDPHLRISRVVGDKYPNVYEVYMKQR